MLPLSSGPYGTIYLLHVRFLKQSNVQWIFAKDFLPDGIFWGYSPNIFFTIEFCKDISQKKSFTIGFLMVIPPPKSFLKRIFLYMEFLKNVYILRLFLNCLPKNHDFRAKNIQI